MKAKASLFVILAALLSCGFFGGSCDRKAAHSPREGGISGQRSGKLGEGIEQTFRQSEDPSDASEQRQERTVEERTVMPAGGSVEEGERLLPDGTREVYKKTLFPGPSEVTRVQTEKAETKVGPTFDFSKVYEKASAALAKMKAPVWLYILGAVLIAAGIRIGMVWGWSAGGFVALAGVLPLILYNYLSHIAVAFAGVALIGGIVYYVYEMAEARGARDQTDRIIGKPKEPSDG